MKIIKKLIDLFIPPILVWTYHYFDQRLESKDKLFHGRDSLFKSLIKTCKIYGEYGCGKSTIWVSNNTNAKIISVDSSGEWVNKVKQHTRSNEKHKIHHVDMGELSDWGRPIDYSHHELFKDYTNFIWSQETKPDLVLIDGRFRVCSFLTSLLHADEGTYIIFDDYIFRPHYHFVEKYLPRIKVLGEQCLFKVPDKKLINMKELLIDVEKFRFVFD